MMLLLAVEPDDPGSAMGITLLRNRFTNNTGCGLEFALHALQPGKAPGVAVSVEGSHIAGNSGFASVLVQRHTAGLPDGFMRFRNNYIQSDRQAIWIEKPTTPNCPMEWTNTSVDASGASGSTTPIFISKPAPWTGHPAPGASGGVSMLGLSVDRRRTSSKGSAIQPYMQLQNVENVSVKDVSIVGVAGGEAQPAWAICRALLADHCSCGGTANQGGPNCCTEPNISVVVEQAKCAA